MLPLKESIAAYGRAGQGNPYHQLNHLALRAVEGLLAPPDAGTLQDARTLTDRLRDSPRQDFPFWSGIALADALLVCSLLDRRLGAEGDPGDEAAREVEQAYRDAFSTLRNTPLERESALEDLLLLADLVNAFGNTGSNPCPTCVAMGARLRAMVQALQEPAHADAPGPGTEGGEDVIEVLG
jgi:hypothetical protein